MLRIISIFISLFFASTNLFADQLLNCDGCSAAQKRDLVFSQNMQQSQVENFYVIDFANQTLHRYTLWFEFEFGFSKTITEPPVPQDVQRAVDRYFVAVNNLRANPDDHIVSRILNEMYSGVITPNSTGFATSYISEDRLSTAGNNQCTSSRALYDVLSKPHVRKQWYDRLVAESPLQYTLTNAWNDFAAAASATISSQFLQVRLFSLYNDVEFDDGAIVQVVRRPSTPTFDIVKGTALDCHGNNIPTTIEELPSFYSFGSEHEFQDFQDYTTGVWGQSVAFLGTGSRCDNMPIQTRCRKTGPNRYECSTVVPPCQY